MFGFGKRSTGSTSNAADAFLASVSGSPAAILQQVLDWLEEQTANNALDFVLLTKADDRLETVHNDIEADIARQRRIGTGQKLLRKSCETLGLAYARVARALPQGDADRLIAYLRAIHLLGRASRLARMFHEDLADTRKECLALFSEAHRAGFATTRKSPYATVAESSMAQELAITLLWETAPFDTLTLEQGEYLERLMRHFGAQIILKSSAGAVAPFAVLADGRVVVPPRAGEGDPVLFLGPGPLAAQLAGLIKLPESNPFPAWAGEPLPNTDMHTLKAMAQRLSITWDRKQVSRNGERKARRDNLHVTGGFDNIRRVIAYSAYVRSGGQLDVYDARVPLISERVREVMVGLEKGQRQFTPLEILSAMEKIGESSAVESWAVNDSSQQGYNLTVSGYRNWLIVGGLIALREASSIEWKVGIVRRLYGSGKQRRAGIETLPGMPFPVGIGYAGQTEHVSIADLRDAILLRAEDKTNLVVPFECDSNALYLIMGQGRLRYRIGDLLHGNADLKIYSCSLTQESV